jgi:hypothetical protein
LGATGSSGFSGPSAGGSTTGIAYYLDSTNVRVNVTNANQRNLVYASFQAINTTAINNLSATIIRGQTLMSGTTFVSYGGYINLAGQTGVDVQYPADLPSSYGGLLTSLWSFSGLISGGGDRVNAVTVNMQAIDHHIGGTGTYYYAVRVSTDSSYLNEKNIILYAINLG